MGGLNAADVSVAAIDAIEGNHAHPLGRLPQAIHDATAVVLGSRAFVFGGGTGETGTDAIRSVDAGGAVADGAAGAAEAAARSPCVSGRGIDSGSATGAAPSLTGRSSEPAGPCDTAAASGARISTF